MNKKIIKKIGVESDAGLYSLKKYGNNACASIPMTITHNKTKLENQNQKVILCGFGIGISWGVCSVELQKDVTFHQVEY